jgi:hypothetical protein
MRYPEHMVHTRKAAGVLSIVLVAVLVPFLLLRFDGSRPGPMAGLITLTIMPLLVSYRCLHFLGKLEAERSSPTPEMSFIFGVAISVPLAIAATALIVLNM